MSISFDRATEYYDATRGYPPGVEGEIADAISSAAGATPTTRFLEMGVGTGRIAFPLITRGYDYAGIDLSEKMMALLQHKIDVYAAAHPDQPLRVDLRQGDVTQLPYPAASFDVTLMVHVLHLIPNWHDAISEALRVLAPGGVLLIGSDEALQAGAHRAIQQLWAESLRDLGYDIASQGMQMSGFSTGNDVVADLTARGLTPEKLRTAQWQATETPRQALEYLANRLWSRTWSVPDDVFAASIQQLRQTVTERFGDQLDTPETRTFQFVLIRARTP